MEATESSKTLEDIKAMKTPASEFFCPLGSADGILTFGDFRLRDVDSATVLFQISEAQRSAFEASITSDEQRIIKYNFGPGFLELRNVGAQLSFRVGEKAINKLRMIERHYFNKALLKSYDFQFGFCIPNSENSWEHIYELPEFSTERKKEMIESEWATESDTFIFVEDKLVIHQRCVYNYSL